MRGCTIPTGKGAGVIYHVTPYKMHGDAIYVTPKDATTSDTPEMLLRRDIIGVERQETAPISEQA